MSKWPPDLVLRSLAGAPEAIDFAALPETPADFRPPVAFDGDGVDRTGPAADALPARGEKPGARDTMTRLAQQMRENGASAEFAENHARTAARSWDRGVESGRIQRPRNS